MTIPFNFDIQEFIAKEIPRLEAAGYLIEENWCAIYLWTQNWPNTTCGFPGGGGAGITSALTVVLIGWKCAFVYHRGRLAYVVMDRDDENFSRCINNWLLPGQVDDKPFQWEPAPPELEESAN